MAIPRLCSIPDCGKRSEARGLCPAHYRRWRRHGSATGGGTGKGEVRKYLDDFVMTYDGEDCLVWPYAKSGNGYGLIKIDGKNRLVPRLICESLSGPPPTPNHEAAHSCGKGHEGCVNPNHLRWATHVENCADRALHGTQVIGAAHDSAKLTEDDVREIRRLRNRLPQTEIAERFGVVQSRVGAIQRGESWRHVD